LFIYVPSVTNQSSFGNAIQSFYFSSYVFYRGYLSRQEMRHSTIPSESVRGIWASRLPRFDDTMLGGTADHPASFRRDHESIEETQWRKVSSKCVHFCYFLRPVQFRHEAGCSYFLGLRT